MIRRLAWAGTLLALDVATELVLRPLEAADTVLHHLRYRRSTP